MPKAAYVRRHADGALDIDFHRRRAGKIRRLARRQAWRILLGFFSRAARLNDAPGKTTTQALAPKLVARTAA